MSNRCDYHAAPLPCEYCAADKRAVDKPPHYTFGSDGHKLVHEPIDVIEDWQLGFHLGAVIKYVARAGKKDSTKRVEDLEKASWFLSREISNLKKK